MPSRRSSRRDEGPPGVCSAAGAVEAASAEHPKGNEKLSETLENAEFRCLTATAGEVRSGVDILLNRPRSFCTKVNMSAERKKHPGTNTGTLWDGTPTTKKTSGTMTRVDAPIVESVEALAEWRSRLFSSDRLPAQVLPGPTISSRAALLQAYLREATHEDVLLSTEWVVDGVLQALTDKLAAMQVVDACKHRVVFHVEPPEGEPWEILWALIGVDQIGLDEPFLSLVDSSTFLASYVLRMIMEARALARETKDRIVVERFVTTLVRWSTGQPLDKSDRETLQRLKVTRTVDTSAQRFDVLCFLLVAASQNNLLDGTVLTLDGLEYALSQGNPVLLDELHLLLVTLSRWTRRGSFPLGVLIGWSATTSDRAMVRRQHPRLMQYLEEGLAWTL